MLMEHAQHLARLVAKVWPKFGVDFGELLFCSSGRIPSELSGCAAQLTRAVVKQSACDHICFNDKINVSVYVDDGIIAWARAYSEMFLTEA
ncbi:hypothetical protein TNCT_208351 [Trichonephila clavata]|uniref:Uncharacterized protein n=1 Tax=Trichonephila clavata TaxID=2740835 RepID=A0A8X6HAW5_TRICU|nr:hypothetical protein TNCT_208351 [Trichonephila clavata]